MKKYESKEALSYYFYLASIFHVCSVITAMTMTSRMIELNISYFNYKFNITGGVFLVPVAFFIQDIITEGYGYYNCKKMLFSTIFVFILYVCVLYFLSRVLSIYSPEGYNLFAIANTLPRHALSFILSLAIGGTVNNYMLNKLKLIFNSKFLALRFISSTAIGEMIFQFIAVSISWSGTYSILEILPLAIISYIFKVFFEIAVTPLNIIICNYLKNIKQRDVLYAIR